MQKTVKTSTAMIMTDYLDGFQYVNSALNFFPHAEGFVDVKGTNADGYKYFYVYNYTDHLGNIRVSYGFDPDTQTLKTLEENPAPRSLPAHRSILLKNSTMLCECL